ncbi:MAG: glycine cleavage system protein GcvH [Methylococcales bacterium]|nr:MAG: glycine cleavage system protein GcvH [Methylococcales bacterium]
MSNLPSHLKYATSHEWVSIEDDNIIRIGITDFAQEELGDLVYIELPKIGQRVDAQEQCAVVESVKTASDLYSPVAGEIVAINESLNDEPEQINDTPYESWIFCVKAEDLSDLKSLLDADAYQQLINQ